MISFIMKRPLISIVLLWVLAGAARAQDSDYVELSAFSVTSEADRGYTTAQPPKANVAITLRKKASAVVMEVTLTNASDKTDEKNRDMLATIKALQRAVAAVPALRFERREIQLRGESRRKTIFSRGGITSYANVAIVAPLDEQADVFVLVDRMRAVLSSVAPVGGTRLFDGAVGLMLERPEQYRRELLAAVFADMAFLKQNLGADFEILPSGLDGAIQLRAASETEVELWIDYRLAIRSTLELANPKPGKT